jgi:hypothetical protein
MRPVIKIANREGINPALRKSNGRTRMVPPIIAFISATTVKGAFVLIFTFTDYNLIK